MRRSSDRKIDELITKLRVIKLTYKDHEAGHIAADKALLDYIDDVDVTKAFEGVKKYYA